MLGASAGWVTSAGITLEVDVDHLRRWPSIFVEGDANYEVLGGEPNPRATIVDAAGTPGVALPAHLKRVGTRYGIVIDGRQPPDVGRAVRVHLTFDRFFVPSKLGINPDTRELVVMAPTKRELRAALRIERAGDFGATRCCRRGSDTVTARAPPVATIPN